MTPALIIFAAAVLIGAAAISTFLWRRFAAESTGPWERTASVAVLGFLVAIVINWSLSWLHLLSRVPLLIVAVAIAIPSAIVLYRQRTRGLGQTEVRDASLLLFLVPLIFWIVFVLWRGSIVPVLSHDALAYHMPKAVMLERAHGYAFFNAPDPRIGTSPANYELLLADVLLLTESDELTEWVGTAAYIALLLLGAALTERWWGGAPAAIAMILLVAAVPVILLHSGAHKNDLLSNVFYLAALLWAGRWFVTQETAPLILGLASLAAAGGTKLQAAFVAAAIVVVFACLAIRKQIHVTRAQFAVTGASIPCALLFFGAWPYVANLLHTGQAALPASATSDAGYGDWRNLWEVPLLLLWRPFDGGVSDVLVPWRGERWFWPRFELYFSSFGVLVTVLAILLPFAVWRYGRRGDSPPANRERALTSVAAVIAFILMLPIRIRPLGFFAGFPRYFTFVPVFILAWTIAPLAHELWSRKNAFAVKCVLTVAALTMAGTAVLYAQIDSFQPIEYVLFAAENPGLRQPYFAAYRAATIADQLAGPKDTIAIHAGFDSWTYPLYGRTLERKVVFVEPGQPIPKDAQYVVIDRAWNIIWGHPLFKNMGQYRQYLVHGHATEEDLAILKELRARPDEYELVYYLSSRNQAVFKRRHPAPSPQRSAVPSAGSSR